VYEPLEALNTHMSRVAQQQEIAMRGAAAIAPRAPMLALVPPCSSSKRSTQVEVEVEVEVGVEVEEVEVEVEV